MPRLHPSNVKETASNKPTAGVAFNLPDTATAPYRSFDTALATGDTVPVHASNGTAWQDFIGTFTAGAPDTLAQTTLLDSSTGALIDWSVGAGDVVLEVAWLGKQGEKIDNPGIVKVTSDGTTTQSIASVTFTKVVAALATEVVDSNGWWDHTNKKFLPTVAGKYLVGGGAGVSGMEDGKTLIVYAYKNGAAASMLARGYTAAASTVIVLTGATILEMNGTTDYVELYMYHNTSVALNTSPEVERMAFWAVRVGD